MPQNIPKNETKIKATHTQVCTFLHAALDLTDNADAKEQLINEDQKLQKNRATNDQRVLRILNWLNHFIGRQWMGIDFAGLNTEEQVPNGGVISGRNIRRP